MTEQKLDALAVDNSVSGEVLEPEGRLWRVVREGEKQHEVSTKEHWLELADAEFDREECWPKWTASVKWDGCVHLHRYGVPPDVDPEGNSADYWHFCDGIDGIDRMIARLQEIKARAAEHFREHHYYDEARWNPKRT